MPTIEATVEGRQLRRGVGYPFAAFLPRLLNFTSSTTCVGSIYSEDILRTSGFCPQEAMLTPNSYSLCGAAGCFGVLLLH